MHCGRIMGICFVLLIFCPIDGGHNRHQRLLLSGNITIIIHRKQDGKKSLLEEGNIYKFNKSFSYIQNIYCILMQSFRNIEIHGYY